VPSLTPSRCVADVGKILCGIQVPTEDTAEFDEWLQQIGYPFVEETNNAIYADFLLDEENDQQ
jgi:threonine dehydratase